MLEMERWKRIGRHHHLHQLSLRHQCSHQSLSRQHAATAGVVLSIFLNAVAQCKREFPCAACANVLDNPLRVFRRLSCAMKTSRQLNETAFELVQKLGNAACKAISQDSHRRFSVMKHPPSLLKQSQVELAPSTAPKK
jgi:hypothetical protein